MGFVPPIDRHPCPVLSAIMSQVFTSCDWLQVCGHQNNTSVLETDNNGMAAISLDIITVSVHSLVLKL
jgi:hypothetical protein